MSEKSLPILHSAVDRLQNGSVAFKQTAITPHPVEIIQMNSISNDWNAKLQTLEHVYGKQTAWERQMDLSALQSIQRIAGLPSSHAFVDTLLGRDTKMTFDDYLNQPENRPELSPYTVHELMEKKSGI